MSSVAFKTGQSHFHYGPDLPFEEVLFADPANGMRDSGASKTFSSSYNGWYNTTIDIGVFEALTEYVIHVKATDNAANSLFYNYTVKGAFAGVLDFLRDIWDAASVALSTEWEAVGDLYQPFPIIYVVEWLRGWIGLISALIELSVDWAGDFQG